MSLWLSTTSTSEVREDLLFRVSWHACGFGIYDFRVTSGETEIATLAGPFEATREKARARCKTFEGNWL